MKIRSNCVTTIDKIKEVFNVLILINDIKIMSFEKDALVIIYHKNYELSKTIKDFTNRMTVLFSKPIKEELSKQLNVKYNVFNNTLSTLRSKNLIEGNNIIKSLDFDFDKITNLEIAYDQNPKN